MYANANEEKKLLKKIYVTLSDALPRQDFLLIMKKMFLDTYDLYKLYLHTCLNVLFLNVLIIFFYLYIFFLQKNYKEDKALDFVT